MKAVSISIVATVLAGVALSASAAVDKEAAAKLTKDQGCLKCHAVDKSKKGPAFKKTAEKYKGKADAEAKLLDFLSKSPKVKVDGEEEEHKPVQAKDPAQLKNLVQYILAQ